MALTQALAFSFPARPVDKLIAEYEGSFVVPANGIATTTIIHSRGQACLSELLWSTDNVNFYPGAAMRSDSLCATVGVSTNSATIYAGWYNSGGAVTLYYKLHLIWPN